MIDKPRFPDVMLLAAGNEQALWPVGGMPLIERVLGNGRAEGATHFVANGLPRDHGVLAHFGGLVKFSRQESNLGSGGAVKQALPMLHSDPFFVMETHGFWAQGSNPPLARMLARYGGPEDIALACVHPRQAVGFGRSHDFCLAPSGQITRDFGAPVIFAGVALLGKALFKAAPDGNFSLDLLFDAALEREALHGVVVDADWFSISDAAGLAAAERALGP